MAHPFQAIASSLSPRRQPASCLTVAGCLAAILALMGPETGRAQASPVYITNDVTSFTIDPSNSFVTVTGPGAGTSGQTKYRLTNSSFDLQLTDQFGTPGSGVTRDLGNGAFQNNRIYNFSFENRVGQGFIWSVTDTTTGPNPPNGITSIQSWGTFTTPPVPPAGGNYTNIAAISGNVPVGDVFNSISFQLTGSAVSPATTSMFLTNLGLTGLTSLNGLPSSMTVNQAGPSNLFQSIYAADPTENLALTDWTLTGTISGFRTPVCSACETSRLIISTRQVPYTINSPSPVPGPLPVLGAAMAFGWSRSLRKRIATAKAASQQS